ncbi:hypothetical protein GF324_04605 [bacterium]|nr:hypothetical protein [bacterium]
MPISLAVICMANMIRSPFLAACLRSRYKASKIRSDLDLDIRSFGLEAGRELKHPPHIVTVASEFGVDLSKHTNRHGDFRTLRQQDILIVTDLRQYQRFVQYYPMLLPRVQSISQLAAEEGAEFREFPEIIKEPTPEAQRELFRSIQEETNKAWERLEHLVEQYRTKGRRFSAKALQRPVERSVKARSTPYRLSRRYHYPLCPSCQSKQIRRVRRVTAMEKNVWSRLFGRYPYHCGNCGKDFLLAIGPTLDQSKMD